MIAQLETEILQRIVEPSWQALSPDAAKGLLSLKFAQRDVKRMNKLATLAQQGKLTDDLRKELDAYIYIGRIISILQSKARVQLRQCVES
jgi:hypothetical protein